MQRRTVGSHEFRHRSNRRTPEAVDWRRKTTLSRKAGTKPVSVPQCRLSAPSFVTAHYVTGVEIHQTEISARTDYSPVTWTTSDIVPLRRSDLCARSINGQFPVATSERVSTRRCCFREPAAAIVTRRGASSVAPIAEAHTPNSADRIVTPTIVRSNRECGHHGAGEREARCDPESHPQCAFQ